MGVGPFFLKENIELEELRYRGIPTDAVFSLALAYWGEIQIQLICPENDAPWIYSSEYAVRERLHHVCLLVDDVVAAYAACAAHGAEILIEGKAGDSGRVSMRIPAAAGEYGRNPPQPAKHGRTVQYDQTSRNWLGRKRSPAQVGLRNYPSDWRLNTQTRPYRACQSTAFVYAAFNKIRANGA